MSVTQSRTTWFKTQLDDATLREPHGASRGYQRHSPATNWTAPGLYSRVALATVICGTKPRLMSAIDSGKVVFSI